MQAPIDKDLNRWRVIVIGNDEITVPGCGPTQKVWPMKTRVAIELPFCILQPPSDNLLFATAHKRHREALL
jgi:hypothetical protein